MCTHVAHRALCARIGHDTRIETGAVSADLLVTAVIVRAAARGRRRSYKWNAEVSYETQTRYLTMMYNQ